MNIKDDLQGNKYNHNLHDFNQELEFVTSLEYVFKTIDKPTIISI